MWRVLPLCLFAVMGCSFRLSPATGDGGGGEPGREAGREAGETGPYRRPIEINDAVVIAGPHASFPLLVAISKPWLRVIGSGGSVVSPDGFDIRFSEDAAGTIGLDHEIEAYSATSGDLVAWVRIPSLSTSTVIYIWYGDPAITTSQENVAGVWSGSGFAGVWHLRADLRDSTANSAAPTNGGSTSVAGRIGDGRSFDAIDDFVDTGSAAAIDNVFIGGGTAEAWFRPSGWGAAGYGRIFDKGHGSGWSMFVNNVGPLESIGFFHGCDLGGRVHWNTAAQSIVLDAWHHIAAVYDQSAQTNVPSLYLYGVAVPVTLITSSVTPPLSDEVEGLFLGNRVTNDRTFQGLIDEARLSTGARSAGWITTGYLNQNDPDAFVTVGPEL